MNEVVFIEHVDHVVTADQMTATMRVIQSTAFGTENPLAYDDALRDVRRERLRVVRDDGTTG